MSLPKPILISIEGNIASGKSTLLKQLQERNPNWTFIDEPVSQWVTLKTEDGKNLLENFYDDQKRYTYTFQNAALLTRAINIQKTIQDWQSKCLLDPEYLPCNVFVTERCLETDYYVFARMLYDDRKMNSMEYDLYKLWYAFVKEKSFSLSGIVHVATPPEICTERIVTRGRKGEDHIPLSYLKNLDNYQKNWLYNENAHAPILNYINYGMDQTTLDGIERFVESLRVN